jgi:hypothetical protein
MSPLIYSRARTNPAGLLLYHGFPRLTKMLLAEAYYSLENVVFAVSPLPDQFALSWTISTRSFFTKVRDSSPLIRRQQCTLYLPVGLKDVCATASSTPCSACSIYICLNIHTCSSFTLHFRVCCRRDCNFILSTWPLTQMRVDMCSRQEPSCWKTVSPRRSIEHEFLLTFTVARARDQLVLQPPPSSDPNDPLVSWQVQTIDCKLTKLPELVQKTQDRQLRPRLLLCPLDFRPA